MTMLKNSLKITAFSFIIIILGGCAAGVDDTGVEFAPQMYHSVPYEPLSQITDEESGSWLDSNEEDGHGEFYNSNPYNAHGMTMREPVAGTVKRGSKGDYGLYSQIAPNDYETAEQLLSNPLDSSAQVLKEGVELYNRFCEHCHGVQGMGDGKVGQVFKGVTSYTAATVKDKGEGHIFWVITHGKGRMGPHASQIDVEDRWKIVRYVQTLQQQ